MPRRRVAYRRRVRHGIGIAAIGKIAGTVAKPVINVAKSGLNAIQKAVHKGNVNDYGKAWEWLIKDYKEGKPVNKKNVDKIKEGRKAISRARTSINTGQEVNAEDYDYYLKAQEMRDAIKDKMTMQRLKQMNDAAYRAKHHGRRRRRR